MNENEEPRKWVEDPKLIERARTVLVLHLSRQSSGELVRIIMDWLDDAEIQEFCRRVLNPSDWAWIERQV